MQKEIIDANQQQEIQDFNEQMISQMKALKFDLERERKLQQKVFKILYEQTLFKLRLNLLQSSRFQEEKLQYKVLNGLIIYGMMSKKFNDKLIMFYYRYLLKKYFEILRQNKLISEKQRIQQVEKYLKSRVLYKWHQQFAKAKEKKVKPQIEITPKQLIKEETKQQIQIMKASSNQRQLFSSEYHKNSDLLIQSRKSTMTNKSNIKVPNRKFTPVTTIPKLPTVKQSIACQNPIKQTPQKQVHIIQKQKCQIQQERQKQHEKEVIMKSNIEQQNKQIIKNRILEKCSKIKLIQLEMLSGVQFQKEQAISTYIEKCKDKLKLIKSIK